MKNEELNIDELRKKVDDILAKETKESLTLWLENDRREQFLKIQILELEQLYEMTKDHPLMGIATKERLEKFKQELFELTSKNMKVLTDEELEERKLKAYKFDFDERKKETKRPNKRK